MVISLERAADLHMAQMMSLPLTVSCFSKIQISGSPGLPEKGLLNVCVCVCVLHDPLTYAAEIQLSTEFMYILNNTWSD